MNELRRILLVEDDLVDVKTVKRAFQDLGTNCGLTHASNGEEALQILSQDPLPSLILLDLNMPVMNGLEFLEEKAGKPRFSSIPTVVLTTSNHEQDKRRAYEFGVAGYLVKPFQYKVFVERIGILLQYWNQSELVNA